MSIPAALPESQALAPNERVSGELGEFSALQDDELPYVDWSVAARRGDRFRIDLQSTDFDTYLRVGRRQGRVFEEISSNDDADDPDLQDTDSRVVLIASEDGEYVIRVLPYSAEETGRYTLVATELEPARMEPLGGAVTVGVPVEGVISDSDAIHDDGIPYQQWGLSGEPAGRYQVYLHSEDFDAYLIAGVVGADGFEELYRNDDWPDSPNGTDSRLILEGDGATEFVLRVRPYEVGQTGADTLEILEAPPVRETPVGGTIEAGSQVTSTLADDDTRLGDGSPYHEWSFSGAAGDRITIEMISSDFDAYISIGRLENGAYVELAENDDYGQGTDSRVEFVPPSNDTFLIRASALFEEGRGNYTLSLTSGP
jgi:hypothetical protein